MRYLVTIEYVGTAYAGWQVQPNAKSAEGEIERVLTKLLNFPTKIYGSGRTDAGVHAHGQTFHFDTIGIKDLGKFQYAMNCLLPGDMHVLNIEEKDEDFHARFSVKSKQYDYFINVGEYNPFEKDRAYQFLRKLDVEAMKDAITAFVGEHNFKNFTTKMIDESNFVRKIYSASIKEEGDIIHISFTGNGFMRYMMRMMVGALIEVGLGKLTTMRLKIILVETKRRIVSYKAPACGLYLEKVTY